VALKALHHWALAFSSKIILGWKGLPGTNTLAYYENPLKYGVKVL
jgi:hypothetical protein